MKHAVLIMAHKNKEQVIRLIRALACEEFDFFVHPDIEWNLSAQDLKDIESCADNVHLASKRIHGELDHWSLPQITLNLIDDALANESDNGVEYSYFLLLSGQDYPIKSKKYILNFLEKQYPKPLIHVEKYEREHWVQTKFMLVRWSHKVEDVHEKMKPGLLRKICVVPYVVAEFFEKHFYRTPYERVIKHGVNLYGGSQWWILPHGVIDYIKDKEEKDPKLIKEFKRTWTPDETFFQTMAMNSPYAKYYIDDDEIYDHGYRIIPSMTYPDFVTPTKGFIGHPHIITCDDFDRIMAKKALFARKFNVKTDAKVLDMIDEVINH